MIAYLYGYVKVLVKPGLSDAHERWHITSTEISERSFPKLRTIFEPKFEYAIAFHGWTQDFICVGGNAESADAGLIGEIRDAIKQKLPVQILKSRIPLVQAGLMVMTHAIS